MPCNELWRERVMTLEMTQEELARVVATNRLMAWGGIGMGVVGTCLGVYALKSTGEIKDEMKKDRGNINTTLNRIEKLLQAQQQGQADTKKK